MQKVTLICLKRFYDLYNKTSRKKGDAFRVEPDAAENLIKRGIAKKFLEKEEKKAYNTKEEKVTRKTKKNVAKNKKVSE